MIYTSIPAQLTTLGGVAVEKDLEIFTFNPYMAPCGAGMCDHWLALVAVVALAFAVIALLICDPHMGVVISDEYGTNLTVIMVCIALFLPPHVGFGVDFSGICPHLSV